MQTVTATVVIKRPIEEVFAFITDARNNPLWQTKSGLISTRQVPDELVGVGTRIIEVWKFGGREGEYTSEVTEYELNRLYVRTRIGKASPIKRGELTFELVPEGTRITWVWYVQAGGFGVLLEPLLARALKRSLAVALDEAEALLERAA